MPRKRKFRQDLIDNGTLIANNGVEIGRIDLVDGTYVLNEPVLFGFLITGIYSGGYTPVSTLNMRFSATGGWSQDPAVDIALTNMERLKLIKITEDGKFVKPIATMKEALKKLPEYTTRAEQLAGLEKIED